VKGKHHVDRFTIAYERTGQSACPIFLFQPFPETEVAFKPLINELTKTHPQADFINFTLPGLGGKNRLIDHKFNLKLEDYSELIHDFIRSFETENFKVVGCSLGGFMASYMLSKKIINPEKVVLLSPFLDPHKLLTHSLQFQRLLLTGAYRLGFHLRTILTLNYIYIWLMEWHKKATAFSSRFVPEAMRDFLKADEKESFFLFDELLKLNRIEIENYKKRILVVVGEKDIPDIIDDCHRLGEEGFSLEVIKDGTHGYLFLDPVQTAQKITKFLF
jgi:pimeloyl-ACP methyl ester carboxylesterase